MHARRTCVLGLGIPECVMARTEVVFEDCFVKTTV